MLMRRNKAETAVHGCHCPGDMAVRMHNVLTRPWIGVRVSHLPYFIVLVIKFQFPSSNTCVGVTSHHHT